MKAPSNWKISTGLSAFVIGLSLTKTFLSNCEKFPGLDFKCGCQSDEFLKILVNFIQLIVAYFK